MIVEPLFRFLAFFRASATQNVAHRDIALMAGVLEKVVLLVPL
jgi:hypothetical protein